MKHLSALVFALLFWGSLTAQHEPIQPYEELGIKVKVLTLSNGKYQESFPNDTLQRIGSVLFDRVTGEVVSVIISDTLYGEYDLKPEVASRWLSPDPLAEKYANWSPYNYTLNNPILYIDPDGRDVVIGFTGGFTGGGKQIPLSDAGTTGQIVSAAQQAAMNNNIEFSGATFAPGVSVNGAVNNAFDFIKSNYTEGEKVVIYGYSYGGDAAVELASKLNDEGISVNLLITVDAADGPLMGTTTDREIPENVYANVNEYQTTNSRIGSRGDKNKGGGAWGTFNINVGNLVEGVDHGNIDEVTKDFNIYQIINLVTGQGGAIPGFSTPPADNAGSSRSSSESSSASSSGSSSSSYFNEKRNK